MRSPQVSVCVPTYNGASYLDASLAGLAAQTFEDFEVLIVDDCSNDATIAIASRWARIDERFKVHVNESNLGLVGNWNRCIELARGDWVKFLFQDDLIEPDCLALMMAAGARCDFVACSRSFLFEDHCAPSLRELYREHEAIVAGLFSTEPSLTAEAYCRAKLDHLDANIIGEPSVTLIRRKLFDDFGMFDPMMVQICDSEMWTRLASHVGVAFVPQRAITFRVHGASASGVNRERPFRGTILDGIVESAKFCDSPQFARFRDHAAKMGRLPLLRERLHTQLNIAFYMMRDAERARPKNLAIRRDFEAVMDHFGGFSRARNRHLWFRFRRMLGLAEAVP
jgi:glycosyltransferase involved in cell wall biosynthesis